MNEIILNKLKQIELTEQVKILFAIESGSRAWNFESKDSDYDVRFVYCHDIDWYLSIDYKRDVIEYPVSDLLDINGWDLKKALNLFSKSNPSIMEWIHSPIIYLSQYHTLENFKELASEYYSIKSSLHHYLNMAITNFRTYLQGDTVKIKKYFYVLRPLLSVMWIEKYRTIPPMDFETLVKDLHLDECLKNEISILLVRKRNGDELDLEPKVECIHHFILDKIDYYKELLRTLKQNDYHNINKLDQLFRNTLTEVWK